MTDFIEAEALENHHSGWIMWRSENYAYKSIKTPTGLGKLEQDKEKCYHSAVLIFVGGKSYHFSAH